jgi:exodeoxyribonuclease-1
MDSYLWYDYETFGINPKTSRISQFAAIRTDLNLNKIEEFMFYCKPTNDCLPSPQACAITGITPQICENRGVIEHEFISKINTEFSKPGTCVVGYNSNQFDDEFTRYTLYRNFLDPYAWHWKNNNSRWDILDVVRMCYALKKDESLKWVHDDYGKPIFKLDRLSIANGIEHSNAHDALADVRATIEIARKIKETQPKFYEYALSLRDKNTVNNKLKLFEPTLYTSKNFPNSLSCTRIVLPVCYHPIQKDCALVFNLDQDPSILLDLEVDELKLLAFTPKSKLPKGLEKLQIHSIKFNSSPMFVSNIYKLSPTIQNQLKLNMSDILEKVDFMKKNATEIERIIQELFSDDEMNYPKNDEDQALYDNFMSAHDRRVSDEIQNLNEADLVSFQPRFEDKKLNKLFLNFKARNYPKSLDENEKELWFETVQSRVHNGEYGYLNIDDFYKQLAKMKEEGKVNLSVIQELEKYGDSFL